MFEFFTHIFCNMKTVCDATNQMFLTCHFVDALQSYIGIYDINKSTETNEWVVTSMQILNQSGFEIEMIFQYCDATFMDTKRRQVL